MNCQIFETFVNDLAREQMMEANARQEALDHSGNCEACALRLALERRLTFGLRALVEEMTSLSASARVEEQLLEAFRSQSSLLPQTRPASRNRYWLAAAAVVLIAFAMAGLKWELDGPAQIAPNEKIGALPSPNASPVLIDRPNTTASGEQTPASPRPRRKPVRDTSRGSSTRNEALAAKGSAGTVDSREAGNSMENEVTTQFLPLSYASPVNLQDGGQLVRVELPRSAMARLGLPVNIERYDERVKADVLVSADGLARAIRFVQ